MLEWPECRVVAAQLNDTVKGKRVKYVTAGAVPHRFAFYYGDPALYPEHLCGRVLGEARAIGGQIEVEAEEYRLLFGDGVNIRYLEAGEKRPAKHQLFIEFEDGSALVCVVQMYGGMWVFRDGENDNPYYLAARQAVSPLSEEFSWDYFESLAASVKQNLSLKAFLATEQRIPGVGNGVLQDILYHAGLHPQKKMEKVSEEERRSLFYSLKATLNEMTEQGGRNTEKDLFGNFGGYQTILSSKTLQEPCMKCGGMITKKSFLGGSVYFCPVCQAVGEIDRE